MSRCIITYLSGIFWVNDGEKKRIPIEHTSSRDSLEEWAEENYSEIVYNLPLLFPTAFDFIAPKTKDFIAPSILIVKEISSHPIKNPESSRKMHLRNLLLKKVAKVKEKELYSCAHCSGNIQRPHRENIYCSRSCSSHAREASHAKHIPEWNCAQCKVKFQRYMSPKELQGKKNIFCQKSCWLQFLRNKSSGTPQSPAKELA